MPVYRRSCTQLHRRELLLGNGLAELGQRVDGCLALAGADHRAAPFVGPRPRSVIALFVGWVWGFARFSQAVSNNGRLQNEGLARVVFFLLRYVSPLLILAVMLKGLNLF